MPRLLPRQEAWQTQTSDPGVGSAYSLFVGDQIFGPQRLLGPSDVEYVD
jgi:hypothetical protein